MVSQQKTKFKDTEVGKIPEDWEVREIQEVVSKLGDGLHGTPKYDDNGDYYFINGNNLVDGKIEVDEKTRKCSKEESQKYKKELNNRTILVSINGTLGNIALYDNEKIILGKSACYMNVKDDFSLFFIKYVLKNGYFQNYVQFNATGTTIKNVSLKQMREFKFGIPKDFEEQSAIAKVFADIDNKVGLNRKINRQLEAIGLALFKHWFIDFEFPNKEGKPYKSSGGEMVDSELGKIPKGWEVIQIKDFGKVICGKTPPKSIKKYFDGNIPFIKIPDMHDQTYIIETSDTLTEDGMNYQKNKTILPNSLCVSCIATIGLVSLTYRLSQTNQQINSIVPKNKFYSYYLYYTLKLLRKYLEDLGSGGSATLNVNTSIFSKIKLIKPEENILKNYHLIIDPLFSRILKNLLESNYLENIRDVLLPRLMSGKIRVPVEVG